MGKRPARGAGPAGKKAKGDGDNWVNRVLVDQGHFPAEDVPDYVPFFSLYLPIPVDKAPPLITWSKFSVPIWSNWENEREPVEIRATTHKPLVPGDKLEPFSVAVCRGYTRCTIIAYAICHMLMVEDQASFSQREKEDFTRRAR
eukprot:s62_g6.t1